MSILNILIIRNFNNESLISSFVFPLLSYNSLVFLVNSNLLKNIEISVTVWILSF
jgi:hypothetical protein